MSITFRSVEASPAPSVALPVPVVDVPAPVAPAPAVAVAASPAPPGGPAPEAAAAPRKASKEAAKAGDRTQLDLVFCVDCTGSMSSYIAAAQASIRQIVEKIVASENADVQFALVSYRDHPPQDSTYVVKEFPFTTSHRKMQEYVNTMQANGGGDGPEAVTAALNACLKLDYRKDSAKIVVIIADAPPHGLGEDGDGFPNGSPDGLDPIAVAKQMLERGIVLYAVACEPSISNSYKYARDFFAGIAKITEGQFLPLASAGLLADVIIGGAREEASLARLMESVKAEVDKMQSAAEKKGAPMSADDMAKAITERMQTAGVKANRLEVDSLYSDWDQSNVAMMKATPSLAEARSKWKPAKATLLPSAYSSGSALGAAPAAAHASAAYYASDLSADVFSGDGAVVDLKSASESLDRPTAAPSASRSWFPSFGFARKSAAAPAAAAAPSFAFGAGAPVPSAPAPAAQSASMKAELVDYAQVSKMVNRYSAQKAAFG